ncbi:MAG: porin, partial [Zoogloeaceae bacterium]|nr:porin [Zoogloeaceae bacterium]
MQKKLIALAVVGALVAAPALAQTNVTIYGSIDMGFSHRGDAYKTNVYGDYDRAGKSASSKNAIDSGISAGNRLGIKGTEDLGNGLKALFTLEAGFDADTGEQAQGGRLFGRQAFVGLTSDTLGTVIAGRLYTPHYSFLSAIDPFGAGTVGQYRNVFGTGYRTERGGENLFDPTRVDNAVAYVSPSFSGFNVTAAYSANAIGQEGSLRKGEWDTNPATPDYGSGNDGDARVYAVMPRYTNGPLDLAVSWHKISIKGYHDTRRGDKLTPDDITNWMVGGTYDFGFVKLSAFYDVNKWKDYGWDAQYEKDDHKLKSWMIGATAPFGKHSVQLSYTQSKLTGIYEKEGKARQWALGYQYAFSQRTNLYA